MLKQMIARGNGTRPRRTTRMLVSVLLVLSTAIGLPIAASTSAHADIESCDYSTWYMITSYYATNYQGDGRTYEDLDIAGPSTASGAAIHLWDWYSNATTGTASTGGGSQVWCRQKIAGNEYRLISYYTYLQTGSFSSIDISGPSTADGSLLHQWTDGPTTSQYWYLVDTGLLDTNPNHRSYLQELYQLVSAYSGTCMDDTGWGGRGTQLGIWGCKNFDLSNPSSTNQLFFLNPVYPNP